MKIKTLVINLKRREDRQQRMKSILPDILDAEFTSDLGITVDGKHLSKSMGDKFGLFPWKIKSDNPWWNRSLKTGEIGCALSHWNCWRRIVETNVKMSLILEDDVVFSNGFETKLESALDNLKNCGIGWELLYLGREPLAKDEHVCEGIVKPGYSFGTFAYMLTYVGAKKLLDVDFEHDLIPSDEFLPAMYVNHPRPDVNKRFKPSLNAYAIEPSIVSALSYEQTTSDTEDSDLIL